MFIELLNGSFLNMFILQDIYINKESSSVFCYLLTNGSVIQEDCGSESNATSRYSTVKSLLTGHLEELKAQVTQLESTVADVTADVDEINGEVI